MDEMIKPFLFSTYIHIYYIGRYGEKKKHLDTVIIIYLIQKKTIKLLRGANSFDNFQIFHFNIST